MEWLREMSNGLLLESYFKALKLNLYDDFIKLLQDEINRRNIKIDSYRKDEK